MDSGRPKTVSPPPPPQARFKAPSQGSRTSRPSSAFGGKKAAPRSIRDGLITYFTFGETALAMTGDLLSAEVWHHGAPICAEAWADLAAQNDAVNRALSKLIEGGAWGAAVGSSLCMLAPIIANNVPLNPMIQLALRSMGERLINQEELTPRMKDFIARAKAQEDQKRAAARNGHS